MIFCISENIWQKENSIMYLYFDNKVNVIAVCHMAEHLLKQIYYLGYG